MKKVASPGLVDPPVQAAARTVSKRHDFFREKLNACASLSPLVLALVVVGGLGFLCLENLGGAGNRHVNYDHSEAVFKLLFRN